VSERPFHRSAGCGVGTLREEEPLSRIIIVVCLVGLTALACGPATPEPVTEGDGVQDEDGCPDP
jgi:hypothetical protein